MKIGVLALQGDFAEHIAVLRRLGVEARGSAPAAAPGGPGWADHPGGESTTIGKLAVAYGLMEPLREFGEQQAIWGTCAGAIFLSKDARRQPAAAGLDGHHRRAQCLWPAGGQL